MILLKCPYCDNKMVESIDLQKNEYKKILTCCNCKKDIIIRVTNNPVITFAKIEDFETMEIFKPL